MDFNLEVTDIYSRPEIYILLFRLLFKEVIDNFFECSQFYTLNENITLVVVDWQVPEFIFKVYC
jgi:hypothetical protein